MPKRTTANQRTIQPVDGIPLRLRRRRDGSVALTDARGAVDAAEYQLPSRHLFLYSWLLDDGAKVASVDAGPPRTVTLTLANATARYEAVADEQREPTLAAMASYRGGETPEHVLVGLGQQGIVAELVEATAFDPAPLGFVD